MIKYNIRQGNSGEMLNYKFNLIKSAGNYQWNLSINFWGYRMVLKFFSTLIISTLKRIMKIFFSWADKGKSVKLWK